MLPWSRPDGKSQVTIEYGAYGAPRRVWAVVIAIQHDAMLEKFGSEKAELEFIQGEIKQHVIDSVIPSELIDSNTDIIINGTGRFVVDESSMMYIAGTKIDWVEQTFGSQFEIVNPNAQSGCGCGESFGV